MAVMKLDEKSMMKTALKARGMTQVKLAEKLGITQNALSTNMTRERVSMDKFKEVMSALGYDVYVVDRETGETVWALEM